MSTSKKTRKTKSTDGNKYSIEYFEQNTVFSNRKFYCKLLDGKYRCYTEREFSQVVKKSIGYHRVRSGDRKKKLDDELRQLPGAIAANRYADNVVNGIAGYSDGFHVIPPRTIFCKEGYRIEEPNPDCDWSDLKEMFKGCFSSAIEESFFHAWFRSAYLDLRRGLFGPSMTLVFAGEVGTGKSLLRDFLVVGLGNRGGFGEPYSCMSGKTQFNGDILRYELQVIDDDGLNPDARSRTLLGEHIKKFCVAGQRRIETKGVDAWNLKTYGRLVICVNSEDSSINVLPHLQSSLWDKIMILQTKGDMASKLDGLTQAEKDEWFSKIVNQIPGYLHWLLNEFEITKSMRRNPKERRMGFDAYKSPEILEIIAENSADFEIHSWLLRFLELNNRISWKGSAFELMQELVNTTKKNPKDSLFCKWVKEIKSHGSLGTMMGKAAVGASEQGAGQIHLKADRTASKREWSFSRPHVDGNKANGNPDLAA